MGREDMAQNKMVDNEWALLIGQEGQSFQRFYYADLIYLNIREIWYIFCKFNTSYIYDRT